MAEQNLDLFHWGSYFHLMFGAKVNQEGGIWGSGLFLLLHLDLGELGHLKLVAFVGAWLSEEFSRAHWIFPVCAPQNAM